MSDDNDDDDEIVHLSEDPRWQSKHGAPQDDKPIVSKDDAVEWLNSHGYAANIISGKFKVQHEMFNGDIEFMERRDFINGFENKRILVDDGEKQKITPITEIWLKSPNRKTYTGIVFDPSRLDNDDSKYNLWKGWRIAGLPGDCTIFLDYMENIICAGNKDNFKFLMALVAQMFQYPHFKPGIAVVIRGDEGVGKSFFVEKLGMLTYPYYFKTSNPAYIFGDHNGQLKNKILLHLEEAIWAGSKRDESLLKDLITGKTIEINDKFMPVYSVPNHLHLFITGNPEWLVSASFKARRIFALHASDEHRIDTEYFAKLDKWFVDGGCGALMHYFMNYDLSGIDLRLVPVTDELVVQRQASMSPVQQWWYSILNTKEIPYGDMNNADGHVYIIKKLMVNDYNHSATGARHQLTDTQFGIQFASLFPKIVGGIVQKIDNGRDDTIIKNNLKIKDSRDVRRDAYDIPDLGTSRELMEYKLGGKCSWSTDCDCWTVLHGNTDFDFSLYKN